MMWGDNSGWGMWLGMGISTLILVVLIALLVWSISRIGRVEAPRPQRERPTALELLDERLARGEIEPDDYQQRRRILNDQRGTLPGGADPPPCMPRTTQGAHRDEDYDQESQHLRGERSDLPGLPRPAHGARPTTARGSGGDRRP